MSPLEFATPGRGSDSNIPLNHAPIPDFEHYRDLFENAPCGYAVLNMDGSVAHVNAGFWSLTGLGKDVETGLNFRKLLGSAGAIYFDTHLLPTLILNGKLGEIALDLRTAGRRLAVLANFSLEYDGQIPTHIRVILFDATERRLFEKELLRSRKEAEQLAEVILHSSDGIITFRLDGSVRDWNKGAADMFGYAASEAIGMPLSHLFAPDAGQDIVGKAMDSLEKGEEFAWEALSQRKDGSGGEVSVKLTPHMEAPGTLVAFSAIVRDISNQKRSERALLQSEKLASVGRLASSIAHEINNPLAAVTNLLYLLNLQANTPELKSLVETAQDELARVSLIATHTLRFYRQSSKSTDVDLKALFESVVALYRARLRNSSITAEIKASAELLHCHEGELRQIVLNLVANAVDAMKFGGSLSLLCRRATDWRTGAVGVRFTIADTGTGMDAATTAQIFEPFFSTKGIGGTGLGLWVTQDLVEKNGGMIRVRSSTQVHHRGTVFNFFFPLDHQVSSFAVMTSAGDRVDLSRG